MLRIGFGTQHRHGSAKHARNGATSIVVGLLAACSVPTPTTRQAYLAARSAVVDMRQPCLINPFPLMPIKVVHGRVFIGLSVNGVQTIGVLDTGAVESFITPELAAAAKLQLLDKVEHYRGVSGSFASHPAVIQRLEVGSIIYDGPKAVRVFPFAGSRGVEVGAQVGMDWLDGFDYDMDFQHAVLRPYQTSNCLAIDPPWPNTYTGLALRRGPLDQDEHNANDYAAFWANLGQVSIPVAFPDATVDALFDTGTNGSMLSHESARSAGVSNDELNADRIKKLTGLNGKQTEVRMHRFPDIAIGEDEIRDTTMAVALSFDRRDPSMILGMDYIGAHHLWLSLTTNALYIDSGERRKLTPPLDGAHAVGGTQMPGFPPDAKAKNGKVVAECWVETDGNLTGCHIDEDAEDRAFGKAVMFWLTSAAHPVMQPAYASGKPFRQRHQWTIHFEPEPSVRTAATPAQQDSK